VLPGGGLVAAHLHLARTVCRRAERAVVRVADEETVRPEALRYLNRLSDALFVMSRHTARLYGEAEPLWTPEST
ncbi:MAG TPA: ATP:cob(I)alamin adenosyltransferase, partial [Vicinamibacteria bacterium]